MNGGYTNGNNGDYSTGRSDYTNNGSYGRDRLPGVNGGITDSEARPNRPSAQQGIRSEHLGRRPAHDRSGDGQWDPSRSRSRQGDGMAAKQIEGQQEALADRGRLSRASFLPFLVDVGAPN